MPENVGPSAAGASIAARLLEIGAVKFNLKKPFHWSSGWKSPIYCDNRLALSYPEIRSAVRDGLHQLALRQFPDAESVAGVATAGIPQGALLADALGLPFLYVRAKPKDHGLENLVEGKIVKRQKVLVVEDLISTGGSSLKAVEALRDAGMQPVGLVAVFTYGLDVALKSFEAAGVPLATLTDYQQMLTQAVALHYINEEELKGLKAWRVDPAHWKE